MPHPFLTLEGTPDPRRRRKARPAVMRPDLGAVPAAHLRTMSILSPADAAARIAAQKASVEAKREASEEALYRDYTAAEGSKQGAKREELFKYGSFDLKDNAPSIFATYGINDLGSYDEESLGEIALLGLIGEGYAPEAFSRGMVNALGTLAACTLAGYDFDPSDMDQHTLEFWGRLKRMFTPPRSVRQVFSEAYRAVSKVKVAQALRPITKMKVPSVLKKVVRYAGAVQTLPLTLAAGKVRNKVFGLKGSEISMFDKAAKVGRMTAVAVASVVGAPALAGAMGPKAGGLLLKAQGSSLFGPGALGKLSSVLIKDAAKDALWRVTKDAAGKLIGEKFNKSQIPAEDYAAIPEGVPVPSLTPPEAISTPAFVAGTGGMNPDTQVQEQLQPFGEAQPYPQSARDQSDGILASTRLDPQDRTAYLSPERTEQLVSAVTGEDERPLKELIAERRLEQSSMRAQDDLEAEMDSDGQPTLRAQVAFIRRKGPRSKANLKSRHTKTASRPAPRPKTLLDLFGPGAEQRRLARLRRIVHE